MSTEFPTIPLMFLHRAATTADKLAFRFPAGNSWSDLSWGETGARVRNIACGLRSLGVTAEQRCAILSSTRIDWILSDLGILCAGGATTTVYPASTAEECAYILQDSATVAVFAEDAGQIAKLAAQRANLPDLKHIITFDGQAGHDGWVLTLADLEQLGQAWHAAHPGAYEAGIAAVKPEHLATLIYTSGTTGQPKGVELTHDCWVYEGKAIDDLGLIHADDLQYFWLPLAHVFGKVLEAAQIRIGFPTAIDGRIDKLVDNLAAIQPTFIAAVPRIFEKVHNKVVAGAKAGSPLKYKIFKWAIGVGKQVSALRQDKREPGGLLALKAKIADKLVFSKLKARFGGRVRFFISGSAPLSRDMAEFFHAADILILEGYGLTETSAASFVNRSEWFKFGTVGQALPGTEVQIAQDDGEILLRGRGRMRGYHNLPDATKESIDGAGWLHTGDIGELDSDGFLRITDRKKDLIKTSGGKYVAPQALEGKLKAICPYAAAVVVHGNTRPYCTALIALADEDIKAWAEQNGLQGKSYAELAKDEAVRVLIQASVDELNRELPKYATLKKFALLPADLTVESGELTPSLKVKRKVVESHYASLIDAMYAGSLEGM